MRLHFNKRPVDGIDGLISAYKDGEFESPYRSTVALLSLVKHGGEMWADIVRELGLSDQADLHAEFTVAPQSGRGKASHTDVMLRESGCSRAIEVKWGETQYQTLKEWLADGNVAGNRQAVASGWLSLLRSHTDREPTIEDVGEVIYQALHRAAAACHDTDSAGIAYLRFSPSPPGRILKDHYRADLVNLVNAIQSKPGIQARVIHVDLEPTAGFESLRDLPKGSLSTSHLVREALMDGPLFRFLNLRQEVVA